MYKALCFIVACIALSPISIAGQQPAEPSYDVVKISTNLIQIDVTVTDKNGKVVSGLTVDDFEIFENGEKQQVTNFAFVSKRAGGASVSDIGAGSTGAPLVGGSQLPTQGSVRNTFAVIVDDLNMSFASVYHARRALKRFVDQQMQPSDLVAVIRTGGGVGALQQFTSDKRLLHAAIDRIRWNPLGAAGIDSLLAISQNATEITDRFLTESNGVIGILGGDAVSNQRRSILTRENITDKKATDYDATRNAREQEYGATVQGSLAVVKYIISGMKSLPGRKAALLFTDGILIGDDSNKSRTTAVLSQIQEVADVANRSSVVVYTFDTRGLQSMSIQASDNTYEIIDGHRGTKERERTRDFRDSQDGLAYFANQTGGKALINSSDLTGGIQRALDEQAGYYLLAYLPDSETFDPAKRKFNKLDVKLKRPGYDISYRSGFFATASDASTPSLTVERQIAAALMSPFAQNDIALSINALYADDAVDGGYLRSFLHIDAKSLKFRDEADGWKHASFDVAAVAFGDNGIPAESKESKYTIKAKGATYATMLERGFVYVLIVPIRKPGVYQYRVAVRDAETGKIGAASQVIDVPHLGKKKMTLSSLAVEDVSLATWEQIAAGKVGSGPGQIQVPSTLLYDTVLRQFKAGTVLRYGFEVYNARSDGNEMPRLETQARILQNASVVIEGNINKVDASRQNDPKRVKVSGAILLKDTLQPGDYVLQVMTFDRPGRQIAMQVMPFEIVK